MVNLFKIVVALCLAISFSFSDTNTGKIIGGSEHETPAWFKQSFLDIPEDVEEAFQSGKHVMLFMDLDGCPYCTKMLNESFISENDTSNFAKKHFDVINLNVKGSREIVWDSENTITEKDLALKLKVQYSPTVLFLDENKNVLLRINGYRSPENFKLILEYIHGKHYKEKTLTEYLAYNNPLSKNSKNKKTTSKVMQDFSTIKTPLAIIFEEENCAQCNYFNTETLKNKDVKKELSKFKTIKFNATSNEEFINVDGIKTTPKKLTTSINLDYRPGILLYNEKQLISTVDALLYSFHFKELLRYVSEKEYKKFNSYLEYLGIRQKELIDAGVNIDLSK